MQADKTAGGKAGRQTSTLAVKYVGRKTEKKGGCRRSNIQAFRQLTRILKT